MQSQPSYHLLHQDFPQFLVQFQLWFLAQCRRQLPKSKEDLAQDLAQDYTVRLLERGRMLARLAAVEEQSFSSYLWAIVRNAIRAVLRAQKKTVTVDEAEHLPHHDKDALSRLLSAEYGWCLGEISRELKPRDILLLELKLEGFPAKQIAAQLGLNPSAIDQRWHRLCLKIKRWLKKGALDQV